MSDETKLAAWHDAVKCASDHWADRSREEFASPVPAGERREEPMTVYDNQQRAAALVRSWRDNLVKEGKGLPLLLIVGGKVLMAEEILANIAAAIDLLDRPRTVMAGPPR